MFLLGIYGVKYQCLAIACPCQNKFSLPYCFIFVAVLCWMSTEGRGQPSTRQELGSTWWSRNGASYPVFRFAPQFAPLLLLLLFLFRFFLSPSSSTIVYHHQSNSTSFVVFGIVSSTNDQNGFKVCKLRLKSKWRVTLSRINEFLDPWFITRTIASHDLFSWISSSDVWLGESSSLISRVKRRLWIEDQSRCNQWCSLRNIGGGEWNSRCRSIDRPVTTYLQLWTLRIFLNQAT